MYFSSTFMTLGKPPGESFGESPRVSVGESFGVSLGESPGVWLKVSFGGPDMMITVKNEILSTVYVYF